MEQLYFFYNNPLYYYFRWRGRGTVEQYWLPAPRSREQYWLPPPRSRCATNTHTTSRSAACSRPRRATRSRARWAASGSTWVWCTAGLLSLSLSLCICVCAFVCVRVCVMNSSLLHTLVFDAHRVMDLSECCLCAHAHKHKHTHRAMDLRVSTPPPRAPLGKGRVESGGSGMLSRLS